MKKILFLAVVLAGLNGFAEEEPIYQFMTKLATSSSKVIACKALDEKLSHTMISIPCPVGAEEDFLVDTKMSPIIPQLLFEGPSASMSDYSSSSSYAAYFETYAVSVHKSGEFIFHVADYYDGTRIVTSLNGSYTGLQVIGVNGVIVGQSSTFDQYSTYMVHYHTGGKVYTYSDRQLITLY